MLENCFWKIALFAEACGITQEQARAYDPLDLRHHARLVNKQLMVLVEKPDKYNEVTEFWSPNSDHAMPTGPLNNAPYVPPQAEAVREEDVPF
jgi:hypothetical protein